LLPKIGGDGIKLPAHLAWGIVSAEQSAVLKLRPSDLYFMPAFKKIMPSKLNSMPAFKKITPSNLNLLPALLNRCLEF
jgi:hypothetical protein